MNDDIDIATSTGATFAPLPDDSADELCAKWSAEDAIRPLADLAHRNRFGVDADSEDYIRASGAAFVRAAELDAAGRTIVYAAALEHLRVLLPDLSADEREKIASSFLAPEPREPRASTTAEVPRFRDGTTGQEPQKPTAAEPLRGLKHLGPIALLGRSKILELAAKPISYVWQDIVVAGTITVIAGAPGEGKTTLLFLAIAARANTGEPVRLLCREITPAPPGQYIVVIEGEHSEASTSRKLVKSMRLLGVDDAALDRVIILARKSVRLGSPEWQDVCRLVRAGLVSDICVDTIARVAPADANDEGEQVAVFQQIADAIEQAPDGIDKPICWIAAHTRKNNASGDLSDISGSVQRAGQADSVLMIKGEKVDGRTVSTTVTFPKLREDPDDYPKPCTFSIVPGAYGIPQLQTSDQAADANAPIEERIVNQLVSGPKTKGALKKALNRNDADVEAAISSLFAERLIKSEMQTVNGRERKVFALRPQPVPSNTNGHGHWQETGR